MIVSSCSRSLTLFFTLLEAGRSGILGLLDDVFARLKGGALYEPFLQAFNGALHLRCQEYLLLIGKRYILSSGALPPLAPPSLDIGMLDIACRAMYALRMFPFHSNNARKKNNHEQTGF
ncbi:hypothetical protein [Ktedonobacter sp. SOSP1-85]|uniref:hypothetical protein n=1 Tax=Ktedonobacter sp. SOSP1-85 TaxID=2778367 RepID=UPI001915E181|nr:hypothetical protein [Ktedonobacter sp. SOSP1-85]